MYAYEAHLISHSLHDTKTVPRTIRCGIDSSAQSAPLHPGRWFGPRCAVPIPTRNSGYNRITVSSPCRPKTHLLDTFMSHKYAFSKQTRQCKSRSQRPHLHPIFWKLLERPRALRLQNKVARFASKRTGLPIAGGSMSRLMQVLEGALSRVVRLDPSLNVFCVVVAEVHVQYMLLLWISRVRV